MSDRRLTDEQISHLPVQRSRQGGGYANRVAMPSDGVSDPPRRPAPHPPSRHPTTPPTRRYAPTRPPVARPPPLNDGALRADPFLVPSENVWCFQIGTSRLSSSISLRQASNASPRCGQDTATTTARSPTSSSPTRWTAASARPGNRRPPSRRPGASPPPRSDARSSPGLDRPNRRRDCARCRRTARYRPPRRPPRRRTPRPRTAECHGSRGAGWDPAPAVRRGARVRGRAMVPIVPHGTASRNRPSGGVPRPSVAEAPLPDSPRRRLTGPAHHCGGAAAARRSRPRRPAARGVLAAEPAARDGVPAGGLFQEFGEHFLVGPARPPARVVQPADADHPRVHRVREVPGGRRCEADPVQPGRGAQGHRGGQLHAADAANSSTSSCSSQPSQPTANSPSTFSRAAYSRALHKSSTWQNCQVGPGSGNHQEARGLEVPGQRGVSTAHQDGGPHHRDVQTGVGARGARRPSRSISSRSPTPVASAVARSSASSESGMSLSGSAP